MLLGNILLCYTTRDIRETFIHVVVGKEELKEIALLLASFILRYRNSLIIWYR